MTVAANLVLGRRALREVKRALQFGAVNRRDTYTGFSQGQKQGQMEARDQAWLADAAKFKSWNMANPKATIFQQIEKGAEISRRSGVGNCGDQCDVAFAWLTHNGARALGYFQLKRLFPYLDHAFLVLGLPAKPEDEFEALDGVVPEELGDNAVILDPWLNVCYHATDVNWRHGFRRMVSDLAIAASKNDQADDDEPAPNFLHDRQTRSAADEVASRDEFDMICIAYFAG